MIYDLIIKNGSCVLKNPKTHRWSVVSTDIGVLGSKVKKIGFIPDAQGKQILNAKHLFVLPGLIDSQVHFRTPGLEHKETFLSGSQAALKGGITTVFDMPNTQPPTIDEASYKKKIDVVKKQSHCDFALFVGACSSNVQNLKKLENSTHCSGVKIFMGSSTGNLLIDQNDDLDTILKTTKRRSAIHSEDEERLSQRKKFVSSLKGVEQHPFLRDTTSALLSTKKVFNLAKKYNHPIHILHITTLEELYFIKKERKKLRNKNLVSLECTPQHLFLHAPECYKTYGTLAQMNPPIRAKKHQDQLWKSVRDGTINVIGSDHAPHTLEEKHKVYPQSPSGMPGVQTSVPLLLTAVNQKKLSLIRLVQLMSFNPAKLFGIKNKGEIMVNNDADFTLIDLKHKYSWEQADLISLAPSPFVGRNFIGKPTHTIVRGKVFMEGGVVTQKTPSGQGVSFHNQASG